MSNPFLGMVVQFGGTFAPRGWAFCQSQLYPINQYTALFAILGTTYGGNGVTNFGLPDFRGRQIMGAGSGPGLTPRDIGQVFGAEQTTMTVATMPAHTHSATFASSGSSFNAIQVPATQQQAQSGSFLARAVDGAPNPDMIPRIYTPTTTAGNRVPLAGLNVAGTVSVGLAGSNLPFSLVNPYTAVNVIIAVQGFFPTRN